MSGQRASVLPSDLGLGGKPVLFAGFFLSSGRF